MADHPRQTFLFPDDEPDERPARPDASLPENPAADEAPSAPSPAAGSPPSRPSCTSDQLPPVLAGKRVWGIDAHGLIYQVFHALPEMTSPAGEPVGAVFGFARDLFRLLDQQQPDYLFCAFDEPGKTFRHELFGDYKLHRKAMPDALVPQIAAIRRLVEALCIPALSCAGYEADDVLATLAQRTAELGGECLIVTGDKDCRQLIGERVRVYNIRKDEAYGRAALEAEWGIGPEQVVDYLALVGDSSDNVPGVPGIGPKAARELLQRYGTLEGVLEHVAEISGEKRRQALAAGREQALLSRRLIVLDRAVPCMIDWEGGRVGGIDRRRTAELFREFGFRSLLAKAEQMPQRAACGG